MISPYTAIMFRIFSSEPKVAILEALTNKTLQYKEIEVLLGDLLSREAIIYHMNGLVKIGLVEKMRNHFTDELHNVEFKLTNVGKHTIMNYKSFNKNLIAIEGI